QSPSAAVRAASYAHNGSTGRICTYWRSVRNDVDMSDDSSRKGGVLSGLPNSRPQRRSERRNGKRTTPPVPTGPEAGQKAAVTPARASAGTKKSAAKPADGKSGAARSASRKAAARKPRLDQPRQPPGSPPP